MTNKDDDNKSESSLESKFNKVLMTASRCSQRPSVTISHFEKMAQFDPEFECQLIAHADELPFIDKSIDYSKFKLYSLHLLIKVPRAYTTELLKFYYLRQPDNHYLLNVKQQNVFEKLLDFLDIIAKPEIIITKINTLETFVNYFKKYHTFEINPHIYHSIIELHM